jgi:hypothetical protein
LFSGCDTNVAIDNAVTDNGESSSASTEGMPGWETFRHDESGFAVSYPSDWKVVETEDFVRILSPERQLSQGGESGAPLVSMWFGESVQPSSEDVVFETTIDGKKAYDSGWEVLPGDEIMAGGDKNRDIEIEEPRIQINAYAGHPEMDPDQKNEKILDEIVKSVRFE